MILLQEKLPREAGGSDRAERYFAMIEDMLAAGAPKPIAFITLISHRQTDYSRALRAQVAACAVPAGSQQGLRAIASVVRRDELERLASAPEAARAAVARRSSRSRQGARAAPRPAPRRSTKSQSKDLLRAYGIATPTEIAAHSADDAVKAAKEIGYPVVLKAVSAKLLHKSDAGAVALHLQRRGGGARRL